MLRRGSQRGACSAPPGFTLLELLVAVVILLILATLVTPSYKRIRQNAEKALCMGNLRALHVALNSYTQDENHWPQEPEGLFRDASEEWWIDTLHRKGIAPKTWICPAFRRLHEEDPKRRGEIPKMHYVPTHFDELQFTPYKWSTMPWLIEVGNFHGGGNLLIFPDGSIRAFGEIVEEHESGQNKKKGDGKETHVSVVATVPGTEESSTPAPAVFTFTRTGDNSAPLEVAFKVTGSATNGSDYRSLPELITIPINSATFSLSVSPIDDAIEEENEEVIATIEPGPYKLGGSPTAKIVIIDDDTKEKKKEKNDAP